MTRRERMTISGGRTWEGVPYGLLDFGAPKHPCFRCGDGSGHVPSYGNDRAAYRGMIPNASKPTGGVQ